MKTAKSPKTTDETPIEQAEQTQKPAGKKQFRFAVKFSDRREKKSNDHPAAVEELESPGAAYAVAEPEASPPKKTKKTKKQKKKRKLPLVFVLSGAAFLFFCGILLFFFFTQDKEEDSVADRLEMAAAHVQAEEYEPAIEIYNELLLDDLALTDAHLGLAEVYVAQDQLQVAIETLEQGSEPTGEDERIASRLEELQAQVDDGQQGEPEPDPATTTPIVWKDPAMERMIRQALQIPASDSISPADLNSVRELKILGSTHAAVNEPVQALNSLDGYTVDNQLHTERGEIRSLEDLLHFSNLEKISIGYNRVEVIDALAEMDGLHTIALYANSLHSIEPLAALAGESELRYLYLFDNQIDDLSPLANLQQLQLLSLQYNQITDITPLQNLTTLNELYLCGNEISNLAPLSSLETLHFLYARNNRITDLSPLAKMQGLTDIAFSGNPIQNYTPVNHVENINRNW